MRKPAGTIEMMSPEQPVVARKSIILASTQGLENEDAFTQAIDRKMACVVVACREEFAP